MIEMVRGDDRVVTTTVVTSEGAPYPWEDCEVWFTVKRSVDNTDAEAIFIKHSDTSAVNLSTDGLVVTTIDAADTKGLENRRQELIYEVQVKTSADRIHTIEQDTFLVKAEVLVAA